MNNVYTGTTEEELKNQKVGRRCKRDNRKWDFQTWMYVPFYTNNSKEEKHEKAIFTSIDNAAMFNVDHECFRENIK